MNQVITKSISGDDLKEGMTIKLWSGNRTILKFKKYTGTLDFVRNIIVFTDGTSMSNGNAFYDVIIDVE